VGTYVSIRGWLECDEQQLAAIRAIITAHDEGFYSNGWGTPRRHINWTHYLFYGADIRESELDWFREQVQEIAAVPANADGDHITGLFFASHEVTGMSEWQIRDGQVHIAPGDDRHRYLDI
jgi:hypothetical protein